MRNLRVLQARHERFLRDNRTMTAERITSFLHNKDQNLESGLMTVVGHTFDPDDECVH